MDSKKKLWTVSTNVFESYGLYFHIFIYQGWVRSAALLSVWFLLILIQIHGVATVTKHLKAQGWLLLWLYMMELKSVTIYIW